MQTSATGNIVTPAANIQCPSAFAFDRTMCCVNRMASIKGYPQEALVSPLKEVYAEAAAQQPHVPPPTTYQSARYIDSHQSGGTAGTWPSASSSSGCISTRSDVASVKPSNGHCGSAVAVVSPNQSSFRTAESPRGVTAIRAVQPGRGNQTIKQLNTEIGSLRWQLHALHGLMDQDGNVPTSQGSSQRDAAISPPRLSEGASPTSTDVWHREAEESAMETKREMFTSFSSPRIQWGCKESCNQVFSTANLEMSTPPPADAPTSDPPAWQPSPPASPKGQASPVITRAPRDWSRRQAQGKHRSSSLPRSHNLSHDDPLHQPVHRFSVAQERTDSIDEMWCAVLRRFPHYPHWTLLKVSRGIYRMGAPTGKKLLCRISNGGLQVRVGGGWMGAVPFLQKYGPPCMGAQLGSTEVDASALDTPASMERLLLPTKSWATKIGIRTIRDVRERRRPLDS
eukprot:CAMPEP_0172932398 /NCGR_PEP_ID=MMETSP1075-20121228/219980_1 /TAXON_ID=2916 /ORGANISM="Ceratium fusus, Strain PA161109" /LENGTH=453 /DNA_ID=CAMNT_0013793725 /DNA_START=242 /DNA_END=1604 /DNA_ORIENTATION=+